MGMGLNNADLQKLNQLIGQVPQAQQQVAPIQPDLQSFISRLMSQTQVNPQTQQMTMGQPNYPYQPVPQPVQMYDWSAKPLPSLKVNQIAQAKPWTEFMPTKAQPVEQSLFGASPGEGVSNPTYFTAG